MAKRKKSPPPIDLTPARGAPQLGETSNVSLPASAQHPSARTRLLASLIIVFHFGVLLIAFSANLAPSYLQGRLTEWLTPYTTITNQAYNSFPLELTHAEPFDFPLYVELLPSENSSENWYRMLLPGSNSRQTDSHDFRWSRWSNFSRVIQLIATDQPDNEILSDVAARLVVIAESQTGDSFREIRLIAPRVLSYDEDARVASGASSGEADELSPTVTYRATIVRNAAQEISLVPEQIPLRTAKPVNGPTERP